MENKGLIWASDRSAWRLKILINSVCTLARTETVEVAGRFSAAFPEFQPAWLAHPWKEQADRSARLWFWPQDRGGNGMFVAAWVQKN